jgi:hypothetical protein
MQIRGGIQVKEIVMAQKSMPETRKPKAPVRLPQRSEEVAGDEQAGTTPIAAAQKKPGPGKSSQPRQP